MQQKTRSNIAVGSRLVFVDYLDAEQMTPDQRIFAPGDFVVVAAINEDGGLQCFPCNEHGRVVSLEGDTVFPEEVTHLAYAPRVEISIVSQ